MKEILEAVMRRLKEQVPDLAYVSEDWGQMDYYNEAPPVKFPCALISVSHIGFESETWGLRRARLTFVLPTVPFSRVTWPLRNSTAAGHSLSST